MTTHQRFLAASVVCLIASLPLAGSAQPRTDSSDPAGQAPYAGMMSRMGGSGPMPMMGGAQLRAMGMGMGEHVEGRIAFLKAELKITDAQSTAWNGFADALRANAKRLSETRRTMMRNPAAATFMDRLDQQERGLSARLENTRAIKTAYSGLYPKLTDEQKKAADRLLASPMGMMAMGGMGQMMDQAVR